MAKSSELVDLIATQEPESTAKGKIVVVTVPVAFVNKPQTAGKIRLSLTIHQAEYLAAQLRPVLVVARANDQRTK